MERGFSPTGGIYLKTEQFGEKTYKRHNALVFALLGLMIASQVILPIATNRFSQSVTPESHKTHAIQTVNPQIAHQARDAHDQAMSRDSFSIERLVIK